ncbi:MAG: hypothetical protein HBSIN02_11410 [Bacteroidia bacterium]|nr:MAG: hypothetical protein HBSIN02_11410 [Bacteroidia bacterium]
MSAVHVIPSTADLIAEVAHHIGVVETDLTRMLVVFPGKRPSHVLRKVLANRRGSAFLPPLVFSYDEFIDHLRKEHLGGKGRDIDMLDAASLLYEIHSVSPRLGGDHFASFDRFLPLGFRLFDELEELLLAGADAKHVAEELGSLTFGERHLLAKYYEEFYDRLKRNGLSTRSTRLVEVATRAGELDLSRYTRIILAGFYALTPTDRRLFERLAKTDHAVMIFQDGPGLKNQIGWLLDGDDSSGQMDLFEGSVSSEGKRGGPRIHFYRSTDTHGQVFALSARLKSILDEGKPLDERTVIVLPSSESLFPVLYQALSLFEEEAYNISLGYPLARTPLYGLLGSLLDLVAGAQGEAVHKNAYFRFVLHPYIKNVRMTGRTDVTRVLFHALEETLAREGATIVELRDLEGRHVLFERIAAGLSSETEPLSATALKEHLKSMHDRTIRPFLKPETLGAFAQKIRDLVFFISDESTAWRHPLFARYAGKLLEIVEVILRSEAATRVFDDATSYATFLRSYIGPQAVPFPGTPLRGLQVLGLLETRSLSFDRVFVLDASDDILPGGRSAGMLIPQKLRERLGMETHRDREKLIEYHFNGLIEGAKEVHVFFMENDSRQRSRFIEKILWKQTQENDGSPMGTVRYRIHLAQREPQPIPKTESVAGMLRDFEFSTTALDVYLKCQIRFYYRYILGLEEREEVREEIEQLDVGNLIHRILKEFFDPLIGTTLKKRDLDTAKLESLIDAVFEKTFGLSQNGAVYLLKRQTQAKLREFLEEYQMKIVETQTVELLGLEQKVSAVKDGAHLSGRIDRIERRGDGKVYILDYKIRHDDTPYRVAWKKFDPAVRKTWTESIGSLQLPMYNLLYSEISGEEVGKIVPAYVFLGRNYLDPTIETGLSKDGIVTEEMQRNLHTVILGLVKEIQDPEQQFLPASDLKKECPGCPYQVMCGTQWAKEGRW